MNERAGCPFFQGAFSRRLVAADLEGSNVTYRKHIWRMVDLASTGRGTLIGLGDCCELMLFADTPVDVYLQDSPEPYRNLTDLHITGLIPQLHVRRLWNASPGKLIIYAGQPSLGVDFEREDPDGHISFGVSPVFGAWGVGVTQLDSAVQGVPGSLGIPAEAYHCYGVYASRTLGGLITQVWALENETGSNIGLLFHQPETPTDRIEFRPPKPIRLSSSHVWRVYGSNEPVATAVTLTAVMAMI